MSNFDGCQLPCVPDFSMGIVHPIEKSFIKRIKRMLAAPVALVWLMLRPTDRTRFVNSTATRFAAAAGGVKATPMQA